LEFIDVAVDDHSRIVYAEVLPDERARTCAAFPHPAVQWFHDERRASPAGPDRQRHQLPVGQRLSWGVERTAGEPPVLQALLPLDHWQSGTRFMLTE
jgi:hypothetical protein